MQKIQNVISILNDATDIDEGVMSVLQYVGELFNVSRAYIFEIGPDKDIASNTYEWCADGVVSYKDELQDMSMTEYGYTAIFSKSDTFICSDTNALEEPLREAIIEQGIKAMLQCVIKEAGVFRGFIGVDDCDGIRKDWKENCEDIKSLQLISGLLALYLMKERNRQHAVKESYLRIADAVKHRDEIDRAVQNINEQTTETLLGASMGMWSIYLEEGEPKMIADSTTSLLIGIDLGASPEEKYAFWYSNVDSAHKKSVEDCVNRMLEGLQAEVVYPYHHPTRGTIMIRCGGVRDMDYDGDCKKLRGYHQDITQQEVFNDQLSGEREMFKNALDEHSRYSFSIDLSDGYFREEIVDINGEGRLAALGVTLPIYYDDECKIYEKNCGVKFFNKEDREVFTVEGLMARYGRGVTVENVDYYESINDCYYKMMVLISKNQFSGHVEAFFFCEDITGERKAELEQRAKLKDALDKERRGRETLTSIALIYNSMHLIDLKNQSYYEFSASIKVHSYVRAHSRHSLQEILWGLMKEQICDAHIKNIMEFTDLSTLEDRLKDKIIVSSDVMTNEGVWWTFSFIRVGDAGSKLKQVIFVSRNIDEEKRKEENLILMSNTDELTKLNNRHAYETAIVKITIEGVPDNLRILAIDLNGLKVANDTYGHLAGDELLIGVAECGKAAIGDYGKFYRVGGDEFTAILNCSDEEYEDVLKELWFQMKAWHGIHSKSLSFSVGSVSAKDYPGASVEDLEREADNKMYANKKAYYNSLKKK